MILNHKITKLEQRRIRMCDNCVNKSKCEDEGKNDPAMTFCSNYKEDKK